MRPGRGGGGAQVNPRAVSPCRGPRAPLNGPKPLTPRRQEKPLGILSGSVPKPTQVGGYKYTKARERNLVKELGNLAP